MGEAGADPGIAARVRNVHGSERAVRDALGVPEGLAGGRVQPLDVEYLKAVQATLSEWQTAEDEKAYAKL